MNVFVIHSTVDYPAATELLSSLKQQSYSLNALMLKKGNCLWKLEAAAKIKKSQLVLFIVGETSHKSPYIGWELQEAIRRKKPVYVLKLKDEYLLHSALKVQDAFTREDRDYGQVVTKEQLAKDLHNHDVGDYGLFNDELENQDITVLLEQYKLFLQTSEDLVKRRQNVNSFYISISSALVAVMGVLFAMDFGRTAELSFGLLFCLIGIILSISWGKLLSCYGNLNSSKMKIISSIETRLPLSLFDAEWAVLSDQLNKKRYVSFTESEKLIPWLFGSLYFLIFAALVYFSIFS